MNYTVAGHISRAVMHGMHTYRRICLTVIDSNVAKRSHVPDSYHVTGMEAVRNVQRSDLLRFFVGRREPYFRRSGVRRGTTRRTQSGT